MIVFILPHPSGTSGSALALRTLRNLRPHRPPSAQPSRRSSPRSPHNEHSNCTSEQKRPHWHASTALFRFSTNAVRTLFVLHTEACNLLLVAGNLSFQAVAGRVHHYAVAVFLKSGSGPAFTSREHGTFRKGTEAVIRHIHLGNRHRFRHRRQHVPDCPDHAVRQELLPPAGLFRHHASMARASAQAQDSRHDDGSCSHCRWPS